MRPPFERTLNEAARPQLFLPLRNRAVYREQSFDNEQGGLFVPGDVDVALGEVVVLEISFLEEQVRFRIRAQVKWKRTASSRRALAGTGLAFLPSEAQTREQLEAFVDGNAVDHTERDTRRYALHLEIKVDGDGIQKGTRTTDDLSVGGCFLLWEGEPPPVGTTLKLKLSQPGAFFSWITLPAVVCWHRRSEHPGPETRDGCGVQFQFGSDRDKRRTEKLLHVLKERLVRELRVTTPKQGAPPASSLAPATNPTSRPPARAATPSMLPRK